MSDNTVCEHLTRVYNENGRTEKRTMKKKYRWRRRTWKAQMLDQWTNLVDCLKEVTTNRQNVFLESTILLGILLNDFLWQFAE